MRRLGIFGGTFDPIHYGHLAMAEDVRAALRLEQVCFVPAAAQPLKGGSHVATPADRLAMARRACDANSAFSVSDREVRRAPPSYTVTTLQEFVADYPPPATIWFILGADALNEFPRWHAAADILRLVRLAAVARPGVTLDLATLEQRLPGLAAATDVVPGPDLAISSTALRRRLRDGRPVRYQLPDAVLAYIEAHRLYRRAADGNDA